MKIWHVLGGTPYQWLVMETYIREFWGGEESNGDSEYLAALISGTTVAILLQTLQKS